MTRPRGRPPMPRAISRPSEPVETTSTSATPSREPNFMIEPLPKARSIWPRAASNAFCLSILSLPTRRNAVSAIASPLIPYGRERCNGGIVHDLFSFASTSCGRMFTVPRPALLRRAKGHGDVAEANGQRLLMVETGDDAQRRLAERFLPMRIGGGDEIEVARADLDTVDAALRPHDREKG